MMRSFIMKYSSLFGLKFCLFWSEISKISTSHSLGTVLHVFIIFFKMPIIQYQYCTIVLVLVLALWVQYCSVVLVLVLCYWYCTVVMVLVLVLYHGTGIGTVVQVLVLWY